MSTTAEDITTPENTTWEPRGHPVRWAVGGLALVVALCTASIWFGALAPRVDVHPTGWGSAQGSTDDVYAILQLTNDAHTTVRLLAAGESLPGLELVATEVGRGHDAVVAGEVSPLDGAMDIGPGDVVEVRLRYRVTDCTRVPHEPPDIPVRFRTALGLTRTRGVESLTTDDFGAPLPWTKSLLARPCPLL
jgi:hypothetical protein